MNLKQFFPSVFCLGICTTDLTALHIPQICLTEDCIMASATILGSLDKSADPCQNFYQFACGGWMQKALRAPADRFEAIDKMNQNLILKILDEFSLPSESFTSPITANEKARAFYQSCVANKDKYQGTIQDLGALIQYSGGWNVLDDGVTFRNDLISFEKRMQILQNELAVNVFFIRGLIRHDGRKRLAIVAGGWNKGLAEMTSKSFFEEPLDSSGNFRNQYLQMMVGIIMELWKVSYVEQQLSQHEHDEDLENNFNQELNITLPSDIEYNYDNEFIPDGSNYPDDLFNISEIEDYVPFSDNEPFYLETNNDTSNISINPVYYESIKKQNVNDLSATLNKLYEWMTFPIKWINSLPSCSSENTSSLDNRYEIYQMFIRSKLYSISSIMYSDLFLLRKL